MGESLYFTLQFVVVIMLDINNWNITLLKVHFIAQTCAKIEVRELEEEKKATDEGQDPMSQPRLYCQSFHRRWKVAENYL